MPRTEYLPSPPRFGSWLPKLSSLVVSQPPSFWKLAAIREAGCLYLPRFGDNWADNNASFQDALRKAGFNVTMATCQNKGDST